jgi:hypothetical protein
MILLILLYICPHWYVLLRDSVARREQSIASCPKQPGPALEFLGRVPHLLAQHRCLSVKSLDSWHQCSVRILLTRACREFATSCLSLIFVILRKEKGLRRRILPSQRSFGFTCSGPSGLRKTKKEMEKLAYVACGMYCLCLDNSARAIIIFQSVLGNARPHSLCSWIDNFSCSTDKHLQQCFQVLLGASFLSNSSRMAVKYIRTATVDGPLALAVFATNVWQRNAVTRAGNQVLYLLF